MFEKWCSSSFDVRYNGVRPTTCSFPYASPEGRRQKKLHFSAIFTETHTQTAEKCWTFIFWLLTPFYFDIIGQICKSQALHTVLNWGFWNKFNFWDIVLGSSNPILIWLAVSTFLAWALSKSARVTYFGTPSLLQREPIGLRIESIT